MDKAKKVKELYEKYPYPSRNTKKEKLVNYSNWITKIFNEKKDFWKGKIILELGCGTGELANALALNGAKITAIDFSSTSINKAKSDAKLFGNKINFIQQDILSFETKQKFDIVISLGALHHTINARKGFGVATKHCKKNGLVIIGLYNKYSRFRHRIKRIVLFLFAGNNIEKRIRLGKKLFKGINNNSWLADKYGQVWESYHSVREVLKWFSEENVGFVASKPQFSKPFFDEIKWLFKKESAFFVMVGKKR